jgi:hypothetical protein
MRISGALSLSKEPEDLISGLLMEGFRASGATADELVDAASWMTEFWVGVSTISLVLNGNLSIKWDRHEKCPAFGLTDYGRQNAKQLVEEAGRAA